MTIEWSVIGKSASEWDESFANVRRNKQMGDKMAEFKHPFVDRPRLSSFFSGEYEMQTVYRQSFKKFYMQTGASWECFRLAVVQGTELLLEAKNILLKTPRHYGNNDYAIIRARFDKLFLLTSFIVQISRTSLKYGDARKYIRRAFQPYV